MTHNQNGHKTSKKKGGDNLMTDINNIKIEPHIKLNLRRKKGSDKAVPKRTGILNKGKNNTFVDNTFDGLDVGIEDQGENTKAEGNKFS